MEGDLVFERGFAASNGADILEIGNTAECVDIETTRYSTAYRDGYELCWGIYVPGCPSPCAVVTLAVLKIDVTLGCTTIFN